MLAKIRRDERGDFALVVITNIVRASDGPWLAPGHCMFSFQHIPDGLWYDPTHDLKTVDPWFAAVAKGNKTAELRRDDRGFKVGDVVRLSRFKPDAQ